jgi:hypothetical protein
MNNPATTPGGVTSQDFEPGPNSDNDSFAADDFVVPPGETWQITGVDVAGEYTIGGGPAESFHVFFYANAAGDLPGGLVATRFANPYSGGANAIITLTSRSSSVQGPTGSRCKPGRTLVRPVNGSGTTGPLYPAPALPARTQAAERASAKLGTARLPASLPKMARTNFSGSTARLLLRRRAHSSDCFSTAGTIPTPAS